MVQETGRHGLDPNPSLFIRGVSIRVTAHPSWNSEFSSTWSIQPRPWGWGQGETSMFQALTQHMRGSQLSGGFPRPMNELQRQVEAVIFVERNRAPELARRPWKMRGMKTRFYSQRWEGVGKLSFSCGTWGQCRRTR